MPVPSNRAEISRARARDYGHHTRDAASRRYITDLELRFKAEIAEEAAQEAAQAAALRSADWHDCLASGVTTPR